jgi:hypothetical protein
MPIINYDSLLNCLLDLEVRYISISKTIYNWYKNKDIEYTVLSLEDVRSKYKKSDTVFILGGSESINDITDEQWSHIAEHDSIGMNLWPVHHFVPTYYYTNYPRNKVHFDHFKDSIKKNIHKYNKTIFFISSNRALRRGIHPRIIPDLFPEASLCCFYEYTEPIKLRSNEMITQDSFSTSLYYRGGLSLILDLINSLQYKHIVLMGIDLRNSVHFYDTYPNMHWQFDTGYSLPIEIKRNKPHETLNTKGDTKIPMSEYLYAVNDLYFKPSGITLSVGSDRSILLDRLPLYKFPV